MMRSLWVAKTGLDVEQTQLDVISNNLANVNTTGFKRQRAMFEDLLYQNMRQVGAQSTQQTVLPSGLNLGVGAHTVATARIHIQGNLNRTENALDLAINGHGFFQVQMPDGTTTYTRDGSFHVDNEGQVVTSSGYPIEPAIIIPEGSQQIVIGKDGTVSITQPGDAQAQQIGQIQLANFINPPGLQSLGENLYAESTASGAPVVGNAGEDGLGSINQGYVETSNVNVVEELVNMIATQRAYEINTKAVSTSDEMLSYVNNNL